MVKLGVGEGHVDFPISQISLRQNSMYLAEEMKWISDRTLKG